MFNFTRRTYTQYRKKSNFNFWKKKRLYQIQKNHWMFNGGLLGFVFGMVYLSIPLYRKFCQSVGLLGDYEEKDYSEMSQKKNKINKMRKLRVIFESEVDPKLDWEFEPI